jgi:hypothetical protein
LTPLACLEAAMLKVRVVIGLEMAAEVRDEVTRVRRENVRKPDMVAEFVCGLKVVGLLDD